MSEKYWLAQAMMRYGSAFVQALGNLIQWSDPINYENILKSFPDYVAEYKKIAKTMKLEDEAKP